MLPHIFSCFLKLTIKILRYDFFTEGIIYTEFPGKSEEERLIIQRFLLFSEFQKSGVLFDVFQKVKYM